MKSAISSLLMLVLASSLLATPVRTYVVKVTDAKTVQATAFRIESRFGGHLRAVFFRDDPRIVIDLSDEGAAAIAKEAGVASVALSGAASGANRMNVAATNQWSSGAYQYDGAGNITHIGADTYHYDRVSRLVSGTVTQAGPGREQKYWYDRYGNMTSVSTDGGSPTPIAIDGAKNHLSGATYDAAGNVVQAPDGSGLYAWDGLQMMTTRTGAGFNQRYIYDANDERVAVIDNSQDGSTTNFVTRWSLRDASGKVLRDVTQTTLNGESSWSLGRDYIYRDGQLLSEILGDGSIRHFHLDHLGTSRLMTNSSGNEVYRSNYYYPFGDEVAVAGDKTPCNGGRDDERMRFTGHERDLKCGNANVLDYMHARYYGAGLGRFLSVDPVLGTPGAPQSWNRYAYVRNSPIGSSDPTGKVTRCDAQNCTITADTWSQAHSTGQTTLATPAMKATATAEVNKVAVHLGSQESQGYGVRDANGKLTIKMVTTSLGNTTSNSSGSTATTTVPQDAEFAIRGHIDGGDHHSIGMVDAPAPNHPYGDTESLKLNNPIPIATVSHGHVGWHEINNGQLGFTAPKDAMSPWQMELIQHNLDIEQKLPEFWKP